MRHLGDHSHFPPQTKKVLKKENDDQWKGKGIATLAPWSSIQFPPKWIPKQATLPKPGIPNLALSILLQGQRTGTVSLLSSRLFISRNKHSHHSLQMEFNVSWGEISHKGFGVREKSSATYGSQTSATYDTSLRRLIVRVSEKEIYLNFMGFQKNWPPEHRARWGLFARL